MSHTKVILLTGFLGSGKTSFIQSILSNKNDYKIAVIQNEFSEEMGLESFGVSKEFEESLFDNFYELPGGCICCSTKADFLIAIDKIINSDALIDYIIIEPSGLADVGKIISQFFENSESELLLTSVICCVDSLNNSYNKSTHYSIWSKQMEVSNIIIYTKIDQINSINNDDICHDKTIYYARKTHDEIEYSSDNNFQIISSPIDIIEFNRDSLYFDNLVLSDRPHLETLYTHRIIKKDNYQNTTKSPSCCIIDCQQTTSCRNSTINSIHLTSRELERHIGDLLWSYDSDEEYPILRIKGYVKCLNGLFFIQSVYDVFSMKPSNEEKNGLYSLLVIAEFNHIDSVETKLRHILDV